MGESPAPPETALSAVCPLPAVRPFEDVLEALTDLLGLQVIFSQNGGCDHSP
jgi:hypothetical protein